MRAENVNVKLVGANLRIVLRHGRKSFIPEGHGIDNSVRLRRRGNMPSASFCQLERVAHDAVAPAPGKDRLLNRKFIHRAPVEAAANFRVLAFGILPYDIKIDLARLEVLYRSFHAGKESHRTK